MSTQALAAVEPSAPVWRCALLWIDRNFPGWSDSVAFFEQKTRDLPVFSGGTGLRSNTTSSTYNICFTDKAGLAKVLRILPEVRVPREHWRVVPAGEADAAMLRKLRNFGYLNTAEAAAEPSATVPMHLRVYTKTSAGMPAFSGVVTSTKQRLEKLLHQYGAQPGKFEADDEYYTWVGVLHCPKSQLLALALKLHAFGVHSDFDDDVEEIKNGLRSAIRYYPSVVCIGHGSIESEPTVAAAEPEAEPQPNKDGVVPYVHAVDGKIRGLLQLLTKWTAAERNPTGKESLRRLLVLCKNEAWPKLADASKKKLLELK